VRGEVRVQSFTADPLALKGYNPLLSSDGARQFVLASLKPAKDMLIARVEGVATREQAEALNGVELFVARERLPKAAEEDEFLLADLVGCRCLDASGHEIGVVIDVPNYGAGDLLDIKPATGGASVLMPFTKAFAPAVDIAGRMITIAPPDGLFEG
jgi:16S rRNA processing protein RimM